MIAELAPDVVVVVGDVNSTVACALVAAKAGCLVAHVEAGLRSGDWAHARGGQPGGHRPPVATTAGALADAVDNLRAEGYREDQVHLVGNIMVDTLLANPERALAGDTLDRLGLGPGGYGLATLHRPANVDNPEALAGMPGRCARSPRSCRSSCPRTRARPRACASTWPRSGVTLIPPAGYLDFVALRPTARIVLTDCGGVQEETTALGVPCVTLRDNTERPITVTEGTNTLAGTDPARIVQITEAVLALPPAPRRPELWDGHAGTRIADVIVGGGRAAGRPRPTDLAA